MAYFLPLDCEFLGDRNEVKFTPMLSVWTEGPELLCTESVSTSVSERAILNKGAVTGIGDHGASGAVGIQDSQWALGRPSHSPSCPRSALSSVAEGPHACSVSQGSESMCDQGLLGELAGPSWSPMEYFLLKILTFEGQFNSPIDTSPR